MYTQMDHCHTLLWGPPWQAGKTASLIRFSRSLALSPVLLKKIKPARGPRRVLWLHGAPSVRLAPKLVKTRNEYVRGGSDDITVLERIRLLTSSNETRDVSNVGHKVGTVFIGNSTEGLVVPVAGVSGSTTDDEAGLVDLCLSLESIVVDELGAGLKTVGKGLEVDRRCGHLLFGSLIIGIRFSIEKFAQCMRMRRMVNIRSIRGSNVHHREDQDP